MFTEIQSRVQLGVALRSLGEISAAGSAGGAGLEDALAHIREAIAIFERAGNDVELGRSCKS